MEETGLTLMDVKLARMISGSEEGLTLRKFVMSATPTQLMDLTKLHMKVSLLDKPSHFALHESMYT